jgi:anti-sigma B factor antagonist
MSTTAPKASVTLDIECARGRAMVRCRGRLTAGCHQTFFARVSSLIPDSRKIVLDLSELTFVDRSGFAVLIRLHHSARAAGCVLELIQLGSQIRRFLGITDILSMLVIIGESGLRFM